MSAGDEAKKTLVEHAVKWAASQPLTNLILVAMLAAGGYFAWWLARDAVPAHIQMIQQGYKEQNEAHRETIQRIAESHRQERTEWRQDVTGWLDRIDGVRRPVGPAISRSGE